MKHPKIYKYLLKRIKRLNEYIKCSEDEIKEYQEMLNELLENDR